MLKLAKRHAIKVKSDKPRKVSVGSGKAGLNETDRISRWSTIRAWWKSLYGGTVHVKYPHGIKQSRVKSSKVSFNAVL